MKGFRNQSLVPTRSVRSGGIDEVDSQLEGTRRAFFPSSQTA